ncbi:MAG: GntR family transcriptional regulator [Lachnospiraceae bacterium]|nr:GntR family transcriptional regulator [Lachnospiraceae bacterium]
MKILQNSSDPIYKQISSQLRDDILSGRIKGGEALPSVRGLAKDLKISVITTLKAYEELVSEGLIISAQGKGYFVNSLDSRLIAEQHQRRVEDSLNEAIRSAKIAGISLSDLQKTVDTLWKLDT